MLTIVRNSKIKVNIRGVAVLAVAVVAGALIASLPVTIDGGSLGHKTALAVGNGNGNGGVGSAGQGKGATNGGLGGDSSGLRSLNSARADTQAFVHANRDHSPVGQLATYMEAIVAYLAAVDADDEEAAALALGDAAAALQAAANGGIIDADVLDAVNELLDGKYGGFTHDADAVDPLDPVHGTEPDVLLAIP